MRLLNTITLEFEEFHGALPKYAVLSHRWEDERITHKHVARGQHEGVPGWAKVKGCCMLARSRRIQYAWVDTCCIDKTSSSEVSEAINSMYQWYEGAKECYVYMSDVTVSNLSSRKNREQFANSVWFTRGWALQELIAPKTVLFWNKKWQYLGTKDAMFEFLEDITGIDSEVLSGESRPSECTISQRMSWAARRETTRLEDGAYCLMGIFNVNMPLLYGEGGKAFRRLQEEIIRTSDDHTIFAWRSESFAKPVLAPNPGCFSGFEPMTQLLPFNDTTQGFTLSNAGLSIQLFLIPWAMRTYLAPLRCGYSKAPSESARGETRGYDRACIFLQQTTHDSQFVRVAVDGQDVKIMDGDQVAQIKDEFKIPLKSVLLKQPSDTSTLKAEMPAFYGFQFVFRHKNAFQTGAVPSPADALCYHAWEPKEPVFEVETGGLHAAGLLRLSGFHNGLYMFLGFDDDFAPLCLITSRTPRSSKAKRFSMLPPDFSKITKPEAVQLLNLNWLRSQIAAQRTDGETIMAFKGHRIDPVVVECRSLSIVITLEWKRSKNLGLDAWHVVIDRLRQQDLLLGIEDVKVSRRARMKSSEASQPLRRRNDSLHGRQLALIGEQSAEHDAEDVTIRRPKKVSVLKDRNKARIHHYAPSPHE